MIDRETITILARRYQAAESPNIVREYFQHLFLSELYQLPGAEKMLFKGGTALRLIYGSPRFSEDLDFSLFGVGQKEIESFIDGLFEQVLAVIEQIGIKVELGDKVGATTGGYFGLATFQVFEFPPLGVEINVSARNGRSIQGEIASLANDFVPTYKVVSLPPNEMVEEKIFGALQTRKKPRDFYDLYYLMRKGMLSPDQKKRLAKIKDDIIVNAKKIDFRDELGKFLPANHQAIIRDFPATLERELNHQLAM